MYIIYDLVIYSILYVLYVSFCCSESDFHVLLSPYGAVSKVLLLSNQHQALVQMANISSAIAIIEASKNPPGFMLKGRQIFFGYSNRTEIVGSKSGADKPNTIIHLSVSDCRVPVTLDHIYQICKPYGQVLKIVTFTKENVFKVPNSIQGGGGIAMFCDAAFIE